MALGINARRIGRCKEGSYTQFEEPSEDEGEGFPVWLHVYDLGPMSKWLLNSWAGPKGGAFHCGVEVLGIEWSYQALTGYRPDEDADASGLTWHQPRSHPRHVYRESVWLGSSPLAIGDISKLLDDLAKSWLARSYHFLHHNCTDFAEHLVSSLELKKPFPAWVHGLAKNIAASSGSKTRGEPAPEEDPPAHLRPPLSARDQHSPPLGRLQPSGDRWDLGGLPLLTLCCGSCGSSDGHKISTPEPLLAALAVANPCSSSGISGGTVVSPVVARGREPCSQRPDVSVGKTAQAQCRRPTVQPVA